MSHQAVPMQVTTLPDSSKLGEIIYDFRLQDSYRTSTSVGQKQLTSGEWVMYVGDMDGDYDTNGADKAIWNEQNGKSWEYLRGDMDLGGDVTGQDKALWVENSGLASGVPK